MNPHGFLAAGMAAAPRIPSTPRKASPFIENVLWPASPQGDCQATGDQAAIENLSGRGEVMAASPILNPEYAHLFPLTEVGKALGISRAEVCRLICLDKLKVSKNRRAPLILGSEIERYRSENR